MGMVNTNAGFIVIVASVLHQEAKVRQILLISTLRRYMQLTVTPEPSDLAIFVLTDRRQRRQTDKPIALPLAHVCRVINTCGSVYAMATATDDTQTAGSDVSRI